MSLKLSARLVVLDGANIADLQENDDTPHILDLSSFVPPECLAILITAVRVSGSGQFQVYPRSFGTQTVNLATSTNVCIVPIKDQELKWENSTANDDWDIFLWGYFVQKRTR